MRAIVLVGGEGTRLRPLTYRIPKQLIPLAGVPMIERVVRHLGRHGISDVVLSMGYRPSAFLERYPDGVCGDVAISYVVEPEPLDTGGAVRFAALESGIDETFVVVNGDVISDHDLSSLVEYHRSTGAAATIDLEPVVDPSAFGVVVTDADGLVSAFVEKPAAGTAPSNLINAGMYVLEPVVVDSIASGRRVSIEREVFPGLVARQALRARASGGNVWVDAGTPAKLYEATMTVLERLAPDNDEVEVVARGVWRGAQCTIDGEVGGTGFVGPRARVEAGAKVTFSSVEADVVISADADVSESIILAGARIAAGAVVQRCVVGADAEIGASADLRDVVVGVQCSVPAGHRLVDGRIGEP